MAIKIKSKTVENFCLAGHTTLKIGGNAKVVYIPSNVNEIIEIKETFKEEKICVIGEGSNLLVSSKGISEKVLLTKNLNNYEFPDEETIKVESGLKSVTLAKILLEKNLTGLEFLTGIPGSVGGAVTMNSSAHGQAIENVIEQAEVIDLDTLEVMTLNKEDLKLGYRNSFVEKNRHLILNAVFKLKKGEYKEIKNLMDFHINYRAERHPPMNTEPSAGSTFRNPCEGVYVGKLLQDIGACGWKEGGARVSDKHCNFIINYDNASSIDVSRLMHRMHSTVKKEFGYDLIAEIRFVGDYTDEEKEIWSNFTVH